MFNGRGSVYSAKSLKPSQDLRVRVGACIVVLMIWRFRVCRDSPTNLYYSP